MYTLIIELKLQSVGSVIFKLTWTLGAGRWSTIGPELTLLKLREYTFFFMSVDSDKKHIVSKQVISSDVKYLKTLPLIMFKLTFTFNVSINLKK